jgi:hypothetical protein
MFKYNQPMPRYHTQYRLSSYTHDGNFCSNWSTDGLVCHGPRPGELYAFCLRDDNTIISITYYNSTDKNRNRIIRTQAGYRRTSQPIVLSLINIYK